MIRLTPKRRYHVSNRLAFFAAMVLALTAYFGLVNGTTFNREYVEHVTVAVSNQDNQVTEPSVKKRKLNISLLLFGHG